jgi:hypothetical protein
MRFKLISLCRLALRRKKQKDKGLIIQKPPEEPLEIQQPKEK